MKRLLLLGAVVAAICMGLAGCYDEVATGNRICQDRGGVRSYSGAIVICNNGYSAWTR